MKMSIKSNIILFMILGLLLSSCSTNDYDKLYQKGEKCLKNQDYVQAIENFEKAVELDSSNEDSYIALFDAYMLNGQAFEAVSCIDRSLKNTSGDKTKELITDLNDGYKLLDQDGNVISNIMVKYQERDYTQPKEPDGISRSTLQGQIGDKYDMPETIKLSFDNYTILELNDQNKIVKIHEPSVKISDYGRARLVEIPGYNPWTTYEVETYDNGNVKFMSSKNNPDGSKRFFEETFDENGLLTSYSINHIIGDNDIIDSTIFTYTYDSNGRLIKSIESINDSIYTYTYEYENDCLKTVERSVKKYSSEDEYDLLSQLYDEEIINEETLELLDKIEERKQNDQYLNVNQTHTEIRNDGLITSEVYEKNSTVTSYSYFNYEDNRLVHYQGYNRYYNINEEKSYEYNEDGYISKVDILSPGYSNSNVDYITYEYDENYENVTTKDYGHDGNVLRDGMYKYKIIDE